MKKSIISIALVFAVFLSFLTGCLANDSKNVPASPKIAEEAAGQNVIAELKNDYGIVIQKGENFTKWVELIKKAVILLPPETLKRILSTPDDYPFTIGFMDLSKQGMEETGMITLPEIGTIVINTTYLLREDTVYFLHELHHEMGHMWSYNTLRLYPAISYKETMEKEKRSPSIYCYEYKKVNGKMIKTNKISIDEDFAETFSYYIIIPTYLKKNFPLRYEWLRDNVFNGVEYTDIEYKSIPQFIKEELTMPYFVFLKSD